MVMVKRKQAVIGNVILLVISLVIMLVVFLLPHTTNTNSFTQDNTFKHSATIEYTEVNKDKDTFDIHIKENKQTLGIGMGALKDKTELLNQINEGDTITFWTYFADSYDLPNVDEVPICAFSINNKPILTIDESNRMLQKSLFKVRIFGIVIVVILESIGVFLLVRAFRKPKENNQNSQNNIKDGNGNEEV